MAKHQQRSGEFVTSIMCKQGRHGECAHYLAQLDNAVVCHCSCHPPCQRPQCVARRGAATAERHHPAATPATDPRAEGFTEAELDLLVVLTREYMDGAFHPTAPTRRRLTRHPQVRRWALEWGLLAETPFVAPGAPRPTRRRLIYPDMAARRAMSAVGLVPWEYVPARHLPPAALWRLVKPLLLREDGSVRGFTITREPGWHALNIYPQGNRHASDRDLEAQRDALLRLAQYGYLIAQMAGSVWVLTLTDEDA